jgi:hypothetical protein
MGEIRNNTDQPMILPPREPALKIIFEDWQNFGRLTGYYHRILGPMKIEPGDDAYSKIMNCILYPGEKGAIAFNIDTVLTGCEGCVTREKLPNPPTETGYHMLSYSSFYRRWDELKKSHILDDYPTDLYSLYKPRVENLSYNINGTSVFVNFNVNVNLPDYYTGPAFPSWVLLLDMEDRILNILYTDVVLAYYPTPLTSGNYHIVGVSSNSGSTAQNNLGEIIQWWEPKIELTAEMMQHVDHLRVLFEIEDDNICGDASPNFSQ